MSTTVDTGFAPVTFSEGATKELYKLRDQQEIGEDYGLRVGVEGGGCAGMNYILGFDQKKDGDQEFFIDGIKVFMNKAHQMYLMGMMIDWQDGLNSRGFTFINPNATSTCGCGTSFSA
ncbi:iron-sulfur cluster assembly accessory protein [Pedobacter sp. HDW13]|uniref:HesB/IscA family protein n=1 Tax=unclassified Pedobacter TaxID=2628915 RepID=UPI000F5A857F|nr:MULTISPECIES: iron-sulfur cluster assembly accessory protein [unclassified Pedobacter]QIL40183.1 iron-sulfur cluster assembly accessory protein [Pedobacter sp. HDW13]RQO70951.1 iron-sulfur cluster assembly accessory protein [Pedobacter sp. KBW01]